MTTTFKSSEGKQAVFTFYDDMLAQWAVPHETFTVNTRHGDTFVIASGDPLNPPMILLHGASSNSMAWGGDVATYSEKYRVYAVDLIGEAGKSAETRPSYDSAGFAEWLDDVRVALDIEIMTLVGLSLGGWVSIKYALTYPEHVSALVLLASGGIVAQNNLFFLRMLPLFMLGKWGQRRAMQMLFGDVPIPEGTIDGMGVIMRNFKPRRDELYLFTDAELASLTMPVFFIGGEKDGIFDMKIAVPRVKARVAQLETQVIAGGGHAIVHTAPDVMRFLSGIQILT